MDRPQTSRLADYFVVLELAQPAVSGDASSGMGTITRRFPENDWEDIPFSCSLQMFCVPQGWEVTTEQKEPTFFVCTLTDMMGCHQYACCLQVQDSFSGATPLDADDCVVPQTLYKPKVFVILSRHAFFDLFRACLNRIYAALLDKTGTAEQMIATMVSGVQLRGRLPVSFSLSSERFSVRPIQQPSVPITTEKVAVFVKQLGTIHNLLLVLRSLMCDQKMILVSSSRARLADAAYALKSLIYPFEYSYTYVPVLPDMLIEYLESPTPFIMGVMKTAADRLSHLEAVCVDLDVGSVHIPEQAKISPIPEPFYSRLVTSLQMVLCPHLSGADQAVPPSIPPPPSNEMLDKYVRVCILRFFCEFLYGYRSSLELVRLHHQPLIVFHKAAFLGMRCLSSYPLFHQLLDSQMFQLFVASRGLPYRPCDVFDDLVCSFSESISDEECSRVSTMDNIAAVAQILYENEHQEMAFSLTPVLNRKLSVAMKNGVSSVFDSELVNKIISKNLSTRDIMTPEINQFRKVPVPVHLRFSEEHLATNARRLEVLKTCMAAIFDNKLSEARKMLCAVELSLRAISARLALCQHLSSVLNPIHRGTLPPQQFELIVRLMNCALDQESEEDEHGVAYACLYLSHVYCRRLGGGVHQFAYSCIQEHPVWENQRFWEAAFFHDVHQLMRRQYMEATDKKDLLIDDHNYLFSTKSTFDMWNLLEEPTVMQIAADRLKKIKSYSHADLERWNNEEESIVYGQAKHYINLMVYLRVPLDPSRFRRINRTDLEARGRGRLLSSVNEEDTESQQSDGESGYIENVNDGDWGSVVVRWISRLIDRICSAAGLDQKLTERLNQDIPGFVAVHIDNLEQVYIESKRLTPLPKSELPRPVLFTPSEHMLMASGLRCFLIPESKPQSETVHGEPSVGSLLPAEGAVFVTNYRIIFKGTPCNPLLNDQVVIRSIPLMALTKEKTISDQSLQSSGQMDGIPNKIAGALHDAIQYRSAGFQLLKIAFDEEVSVDQIEDFSKTVASRRWPQTLPHTLFAYSSSAHLLHATVVGGTKTKYSTIRDFKKTLATKIPLTKGSMMRKADRLMEEKPQIGYSLPNKPQLYGADSLQRSSNSDYLDLFDVPNNVIVNPKTVPDVHRSYQKDLDRMRFGSDNCVTRISFANATYEVSKSYPSAFVVPSSVSDDTFNKIAKGFKQGRFPVITWVNEHGAMIIRGAGFNPNNAVVQRIKKQANLMGPQEICQGVQGSKLSLASKQSSAASMHSHHSVELQEQYIARLAQISPTSNGKGLSADSITSLLSLDSMMTSDAISVSTNTPEMTRKNRAQTVASDFGRHAANLVRNSGGKGGRTFMGMGDMGNGNHQANGQNLSGNIADKRTDVRLQLRSIQRKNMYILGEKVHAKALRLDKTVEFVPISFPTAHQVKISFKKFLRVMCPSWGSNETNASFHRLLEDSEWLHHVSSLLSLSSSISNLIDLHNASVSICIEDGWDATAQLSSLAQIILDPFYRTFTGFRLLVEKEWLAFGHRFSHRSNHTIGSQSSGIAPHFLMFLDCVHQLVTQFPVAFEFGDYYLKFLAYHSQAAFFRTFLLDCESDRVRVDQAAPDTTPGQFSSIWNYIQARSERSTTFHNLMYNPENISLVLYPVFSMASLDLWDWYAEDFLSHGSAYDIEIAEAELHQRDEERVCRGDSVCGRVGAGTIVDGEWASTQLTCRDQFTHLLETHSSISASGNENEELGWQTILEDVYAKDSAANVDTMSLLDDADWDSQLQRALCKKSAVKLLVRSVGNSYSGSQIRASVVPNRLNHQFEAFVSTGMPNCQVCHVLLPGDNIKSGMRCRLCKSTSHERCVASVSWNCGSPPPRDISEERRMPYSQTMDTITAVESNSDTRTLTGPYSAQSPSVHHIYQGYLHKKGATFKLWKPRWFVLDGRNHKLIYFDNEHDSSERGCIDLCDVQGVEVAASQMKKALLELRTTKRNYTLLADSLNDAEVWKDKIESVLRD